MSTELEVNDNHDLQSDYKYKFGCKVLENHGSKIYCVKFFEYGNISNNNIFAIATINRATIYELKSNGSISIIQTYIDEAWDESYYCLTWCVDKKTAEPLLVIAGELGVIKIINCHSQKFTKVTFLFIFQSIDKSSIAQTQPTK